jgi:hypothetical protein
VAQKFAGSFILTGKIEKIAPSTGKKSVLPHLGTHY